MTSDQGAIVTLNGGETWSSWYNQPTAAFYHVSTDNSFPYRVCGGQQESGSACMRDLAEHRAAGHRPDPAGHRRSPAHPRLTGADPGLVRAGRPGPGGRRLVRAGRGRLGRRAVPRRVAHRGPGVGAGRSSSTCRWPCWVIAVTLRRVPQSRNEAAAGRFYVTVNAAEHTT